ERMMSHRYAGPARAVLNQDFRVLFLVDCIELSRAVKIALRIRRSHFDLAFLIQITLRNSHRTARFEDEIIFLFYLIGHEPVSDAARDDDVILRAITLLSEDRFNCTAAFKDKDDLIGAAVLIILELAVRFFGARAPCSHVLIEKNRNAAAVKIALARNVRRAQMMMSQRAISRFLQFLALQ